MCKLAALCAVRGAARRIALDIVHSTNAYDRVAFIDNDFRNPMAWWSGMLAILRCTRSYRDIGGYILLCGFPAATNTPPDQDAQFELAIDATMLAASGRELKMLKSMPGAPLEMLSEMEATYNKVCAALVDPNPASRNRTIASLSHEVLAIQTLAVKKRDEYKEKHRQERTELLKRFGIKSEIEGRQGDCWAPDIHDKMMKMHGECIAERDRGRAQLRELEEKLARLDASS
jgi:hypothetical protein